MLLITRRKMPDKKKNKEDEEETNFWIVSDNTRTCPYKGTKITLCVLTFQTTTGENDNKNKTLSTWLKW